MFHLISPFSLNFSLILFYLIWDFPHKWINIGGRVRIIYFPSTSCMPFVPQILSLYDDDTNPSLMYLILSICRKIFLREEWKQKKKIFSHTTTEIVSTSHKYKSKIMGGWSWEYSPQTFNIDLMRFSIWVFLSFHAQREESIFHLSDWSNMLANDCQLKDNLKISITLNYVSSCS